MIVHVLGGTRGDEVEHMVPSGSRILDDPTQPMGAQTTPGGDPVLKIPVLQQRGRGGRTRRFHHLEIVNEAFAGIQQSDDPFIPEGGTGSRNRTGTISVEHPIRSLGFIAGRPGFG